MGSLVTEQLRPINLHWGKPAPDLLPSQELAKAAQTVFSDPAITVTSLQYGDNAGYKPLRKELSSWLSGLYGSEDNSDQICVTGGASQGMANILQVLTDPLATRAVWMVAPCFYMACRIFEDAGFTGKLRGVHEGNEGVMDLDFLEREMVLVDSQERTELTSKPKNPTRKTYSHIIYTVPTFSNPSGKTMPLECRERLIQIARKHDALIISDDIYDMIQWPSSGSSSSNARRTDALPRLVDIDRSLPPLASDPYHFGNALSNGSFSKIIAPGVRTGWIDATPMLVNAVSMCGSTIAGGCPSQLVAAMITQLIRSGFLQRHITDTLIPAYRRRRETMTKAVELNLEPVGAMLVKISSAEKYLVGGYFLWIELPSGVESSKVVEFALEENLVVSAGVTFGVAGDSRKDAPAGQKEFSAQADQYIKSSLDRAQLAASPFTQFHKWFSEAQRAPVHQPETVCFSTASLPSGAVSSRFVYLKELDSRGFVIYSNWDTSRKAADIKSNPQASLAFWWHEVERQVRVEGKVERLTNEESQVYYDLRARGSRVGAWASRQSQVLPEILDEKGKVASGGREILDGWVKEVEEKYVGEERIPVPDFWGGCRVVPERIEFWQGRDSRLHDRFVYSKKASTNPEEAKTEEWSIERLSP
ncbi:hypothetical protein MMC25_007792 [Agyrium rufum]|nr:hypothetical protein [Agyrium rufum]